MDAAYGSWHPPAPAAAGRSWAPAAFSMAHSHAGRYLWTDAFGVVNYCSLYYETGDAR